MSVQANACCFIGGADGEGAGGAAASGEEELKNRLKRAIGRMITGRGATRFISGMNLGAEQLAAEAVLELKEVHPDITLECALPYENQAEHWTGQQRDRYYDILSRCDRENLLQTARSGGWLPRLYDYLLENSGHVVAVWDGTENDAGRAVAAARRLGREVVVLEP